MVTLNRPKVANAISRLMTRELDLSFKVSMGQIAKLGLIDITITLDSKIDFPTSNGLHILKINKLINDEDHALDFEEMMQEQIQNDKTYLNCHIKGISLSL